MILTVVGGGSTTWMPNLMRDIYLLDSDGGGEIRLVDPYSANVGTIAKMLEVFNRARNKCYDISVVDDRRSAMAGADFVMTTFSPGSMDAFYNDLEIPIRYGIRLPVSMTVGPPGISAALRTAPTAYEIVEDMEAACPGAFVLNVTNPMSVVTRAMNMAARTVKVIGFCHEFHMFPPLIEKILGLEKPEEMHVGEYLYHHLPEQGFEYTIAGVNHFIWVTKARRGGEDVIPLIRQYASDNCDTRADDEPYDARRNYDAVKLALCRTFGYLPIVGDRHLVEFWPSLCNQRSGFGMKYDVIKTTVAERRHRIDQSMALVNRIVSGEEEIEWSRSSEEMTTAIKAIISGTEARGIFNLPNEGQIGNLPEEVVVETLGTVTMDGATPTPAGELPGPIGSLCRLHADIHEMTVRAALEGDRDLAVQTMSLDPLSAGADFSELTSMTDELLLANKQWLPRFFR